jgi:hypothetical protein
MGCFGSARGRRLLLSSKIRRRSTDDAVRYPHCDQPLVWRCNPAAFYITFTRKKEPRVAASYRSSCTIFELMALDGLGHNDESSQAVGDLSMGFYEASSVPLGMDLYCDEGEDCFHTFENPAATSDSESEESEVRSCSFSAKCPSVMTTRNAPSCTVGIKSTSSILSGNKLRQKLQKFSVWLLTGAAQ